MVTMTRFRSPMEAYQPEASRRSNAACPDAEDAQACGRLPPFARVLPARDRDRPQGGSSGMLSSCLRVASLILLFSGTALAQTAIEGTVHDSAGRPVPNASVSLQHRDGGTVLTTASDGDGKFRFSGVEGGACALQVQAADYFKATYEF